MVRSLPDRSVPYPEDKLKLQPPQSTHSILFFFGQEMKPGEGWLEIENMSADQWSRLFSLLIRKDNTRRGRLHSTCACRMHARKHQNFATKLLHAFRQFDEFFPLLRVWVPIKTKAHSIQKKKNCWELMEWKWWQSREERKKVLPK